MVKILRNGPRCTPLSRSQREGFPSNTEHRHIDLTGDASELAKDLKGVTAEYIFFCAYLEQPNEQAAWDINGDILQAFLDALVKNDVAKHIKHTELFPPSFYYRQQDILKSFCDKSSGQTAWNVTYPNDDIGFALGNFMNLANALGIYAAVSKELGKDLAFPGSKHAYTGFDCYRDAALHARFCEWVVLQPSAGNEAFNVVNGDESWQSLWPRVAERFGVKVDEAQFGKAGSLSSSRELNPTTPVSLYDKQAGLKPLVQRDRIDQSIDLLKWSQEPEVKRAWEELSTRESLDKMGLEKATWSFLAFVWGRNYDLIISMSKARKFGCSEYLDTWSSFENTFDRLEAEKIIPKSRG
ncbi:hypothetical protein ACJ41O_001413 [Fusarium nematophilum]